jgi:lipoprotein NlpD
MMRGGLIALLLLTLAGCASHAPAPVADGRSATRIEGAGPAKPAAPAGKMYTVKKGDTLYSIAREQGVDTRDLSAWNNLDSNKRITIGQQLLVSAPGRVDTSSAPPAEGTVVQPIAIGGPVVARSLDSAPAAAVPPSPTLPPPVSTNSDRLKRSPKGGKLPYSEENLALLKAQAAAQPSVAQTVAVAPAEKLPAEKPAAAVVAPPPTGNIDWAWPATGKLLASFSEGADSNQELSKGIDIAGKIGDPVQAAAAGKVIYVGVFPKHGNLVVVLHSGGYSSVYAHNSRILVKDGQAVTRGQKIAELGNSDADQPKLHFEVRQQGKPVDPIRFLPKR